MRPAARPRREVDHARLRLGRYPLLSRDGVADLRHIAATFLDNTTHAQLDLLEHIQLTAIATVCRNADSLAEAGRRLFDRSREEKRSNNDSHRLRQLLAKYGIDFQQLRRGTR